MRIRPVEYVLDVLAGHLKLVAVAHRRLEQHTNTQWQALLIKTTHNVSCCNIENKTTTNVCVADKLKRTVFFAVYFTHVEVFERLASVALVISQMQLAREYLESGRTAGWRAHGRLVC